MLSTKINYTKPRIVKTYATTNAKNVVSKITDRKFKKMNDVFDFIKKESAMDVKYFEDFESRRFDRIGELIDEVKRHSEEDIEFINNIYNTMVDEKKEETKLKTEIEKYEKNIKSSFDNNDDFFEK